MPVSLKINISISGAKQEKLNYFPKISVGQLFIFCHFFFRWQHPSSTSYGNSDKSIINSLAKELNKFMTDNKLRFFKVFF